MNTNNSIPEIVKRAIVHTITDIGQLTKAEKNTLNTYVKKGWISKGKGGPFPMSKTVYACPTFNFEASRTAHMEELNAIIAFDRTHAVARMSQSEINNEITSMQTGDMSSYGGSALEAHLGRESYDIKTGILSGAIKITGIKRSPGKVTICITREA